MLRDHSNKWIQKHTSFWWKPLRTNHKLPHSSTLIVFLRENELFQRGWGVFVIFVEIPKGWGGHQFPAKMENPGRWGGPNWNSLRGGGLDIFWNYTIRFVCLEVQAKFINQIKSIAHAIPFLWFKQNLFRTAGKLNTLFRTEGKKPYPVQRHIPVHVIAPPPLPG